MKRRVAVVVALVVAVTLATVPSGGLAQSESSSVAPGERFAGVVGVQQTEVRGAVESRTFQTRFERADSNASRAALIAEQTDETRERLRELEARQERLREARANGSISEGQFRARMARLVAESNALQQQLNRTAAASERVPDRALRERGVDPAELDRLRAAAGNLTGPEVAAIARNITGDRRAGPPAGVGPGEAPGERGPPTDAGNRTDGGDGRPSDAGNRTGAGDGSGDATDRSGGDGPSEDAGNRSTDGDGDGSAGDGGNDGDGDGSASDGGNDGDRGGARDGDASDGGGSDGRA